MSEEKGDVFDSIAKTGGVAAAGILGSVFFPAIISSSIDGWLKEQMAANLNALVFSCILAAIAGAGIACSIAIPVMKWRAAERLKAKDDELTAKDTEIVELEKQVAELEKRPRQEQLDDALAEKEIEQREPLETAFAVVCSTCLVDARGGLVDPLLFDTENRHLGIIGLDRNSVKELEDLGLIRKRENLAPNRDVIKAEDLNSPLIHIADGVEIESDTVIYRFKSGHETFNRNRQQWKPAGKWGGICHVVDLGIYEFTSRGRRKAESMDTPTAANIRAYVSTCLTDSHIEEDRAQD